MREFKRTHPWLKFSLDLNNLGHWTWYRLGETVSMSDVLAGIPLRPEAAKRLHRVFLAKGALATTAIEGNTLSEAEVMEHLEGRLELPPSRRYLAREVDNIVRACNRIAKEILGGKSGSLSPGEILTLNREVLEGLPLPEEVVPGRIRNYSVTVGRYRAVPAKDCAFLLEQFCDWLESVKFPEEMEKAGALLKAIAAHLFFVWIHPFGDGNGRTARLIEFRLLLEGGYPTPSAHLLSNFYNQTRAEYYRLLDEAARSGGKPEGFIEYAVQGYSDQLREQIRVVRAEQLRESWRNYVYERFGKGSDAHLRRRRLVLDLSDAGGKEGWVPISRIPELSPKLAREYAKKTEKTLSRDLNLLKEMDLIERKGRSVRARKEIILAFLPPRADPLEKGVVS